MSAVSKRRDRRAAGTVSAALGRARAVGDRTASLVVPLLGAGVFAALLAGCAGPTAPATPALVTSSPEPGAYRGVQMDPPQPRPTFTLTDTSGRRYDFAARTRGRPTFLFFGFTHCPDVCPTTMADVAAALRGTPEPVRRSVQVVFVTTDPARDTGKVIAAWLRNFDAGLPNRFVGLTGTVAAVEGAQAAARVPVATDDGQTHSARLLLYGPDDYARVSYEAGSSPDDIRRDLPIVESSSSSARGAPPAPGPDPGQRPTGPG